MPRILPSLSVLVCRGCCCGTVRKHPGTDHDGQVEQLRAALPSELRANLYEVDCLGECSSSNVIIVRTGGNRRWFAAVLDGDDTRSLADWIQAGARGDPPPHLAAHEFDPEASDRSSS